MAFEDLENDFTLDDPGSDFSRSTVTLTGTAVDGGNAYRCYKAHTESGDFEHLVTAQCGHNFDNGTYDMRPAFWGVTTDVTDSYAAGDALVSFWLLNNTPLRRVYLRGYNNGSQVFSDFWAGPFTEDTDYYFTPSLDEAVGANGTAYLKIYSDSDRTTLVDTLSGARDEDPSYTNVYALSYGTHDAGDLFDSITKNLDLQEAATSGRIMSSLAAAGGLAGLGGIAGKGGGLAA